MTASGQEEVSVILHRGPSLVIDHYPIRHALTIYILTVRCDEQTIDVMNGSIRQIIVLQQVNPLVFGQSTPSAGAFECAAKVGAPCIERFIRAGQVRGLAFTPCTPAEQTYRSLVAVVVGTIRIRICLNRLNQIILVFRQTEGTGTPISIQVFTGVLQVTMCEINHIAAGVDGIFTAQSARRCCIDQSCPSSLSSGQHIIVAYQQFLVIGQGIVRSARAFNRIARSEFQRNRLRDSSNLSFHRVCAGLDQCRVISDSLIQFINGNSIKGALGSVAQRIVSVACCLNSVHTCGIQCDFSRNSLNQVFHYLCRIQRSSTSTFSYQTDHATIRAIGAGTSALRLIVVNCEYIRSIIIQRGGTVISSIICYQCIYAIASRARRKEHRTGVLHCGPVVAGIDIRCKVVRIRGKGRAAPIVRKEDIAALVVYGSPTLGIIFNQILPFIFRECTPTGTHLGSPIDKISDIIDGLIAIIDTIVGSGRTPTEQIHRTILRNGSVAVNLAIRYDNTKVIPLVSSKAPSPVCTEVGSRSL